MLTPKTTKLYCILYLNIFATLKTYTLQLVPTSLPSLSNLLCTTAHTKHWDWNATVDLHYFVCACLMINIFGETFLIINHLDGPISQNLFRNETTCFGHFLCPSLGVFHCTHSNGICHTGLLTAVSKPVWHIPLLCVRWKTPDDGQRNCPKHVVSFQNKKNLRN